MVFVICYKLNGNGSLFALLSVKISKVEGVLVSLKF